MLQEYRYTSFDWKPSPVVALATSVDDSQVSAAREDGSLEIWLVSPGSVGWHCQLVIHGDPNSRVSSLIWCRSGSKGGTCGRLFSSSIDGSISEWDLYHLNQKTVVDSVGVSIWQMALQPQNNVLASIDRDFNNSGNGAVIDRYSDGDDSSKSDDDDDDSLELHDEALLENPSIAVACDDGCVRMYTISDGDDLNYNKSMPRVSGRVLSVAWNHEGKLLYAGSSDGMIRCWEVKRAHELYRITVGLGGSGSGPELCVWSLLGLSCGTIVSADSTGSVQFWDSQHGTLLQAHTLHKGDVNALAAIPSHRRVFSAGSDGQVILYKLSSSNAESSCDGKLPAEEIKKWVYVGHVRVHTHDVKALTVAVPIIHEETLPDEKPKRKHRKAAKPVDFGYRKWAHFGVPMLLSAGDDTKMFAYSAMEFMKFSPHDICPAPQRVAAQLVLNSVFNMAPLLLVQASYRIDIFPLSMRNVLFDKGSSTHARLAPANPMVQVTSKQKIICSAISPSGLFISFSNHVKPSLVQLQRSQGSKGLGPIIKRKLPSKLPSAHSMVFTSDSSRLIISGQDRLIYVVDVGNLEIIHVFTPCHKQKDEDLLPHEPPITKMFTGFDGQWLSAVNCFGDVYVFNLETQRQHWFIHRLDGASVTAGGFSPRNNNVLVLTTSSNRVYAFDVEAKQLGEWSKRNSLLLPQRFLDFPGEVIGLSFPPSTSSVSSVVVYSSRAMCVIDFKKPMDYDASDSVPVELISSPASNGRANGDLNSKRRRQKDDGMPIQDYSRPNFEFISFSDPVQFVGHLSKSSVLVVHKPWLDAVKKLDAAPVHRHIFGS